MKLQINNIFWVRQLVRKLGFEAPIDFSIEDVVEPTRFSSEEECTTVRILPSLNRVDTSYTHRIVKKDFSVLVTEEEFECRMLNPRKIICNSNTIYKMGACGKRRGEVK